MTGQKVTREEGVKEEPMEVSQGTEEEDKENSQQKVWYTAAPLFPLAAVLRTSEGFFFYIYGTLHKLADAVLLKNKCCKNCLKHQERIRIWNPLAFFGGIFDSKQEHLSRSSHR